jgi:hypothetical protein
VNVRLPGSVNVGLLEVSEVEVGARFVCAIAAVVARKTSTVRRNFTREFMPFLFIAPPPPD